MTAAWVACASSVPSATNRAVSTTSCAVVPAVRATPVRRRFYLSLDDDLMKRFAGPRMAGLMRSLGLRDGVPIEHRWVSKSVEKAQKRVEEYHYGIRKNLLEYDQVMNTQRTKIYEQRQSLLKGDDQERSCAGSLMRRLTIWCKTRAADGTRGQALADRLIEQFTVNVGLDAPADIPGQ